MTEGLIWIKSASSFEATSTFLLPETGLLKKLLGPFFTIGLGVLAILVGENCSYSLSLLPMTRSLLFSAISSRFGGGFKVLNFEKSEIVWGYCSCCCCYCCSYCYCICCCCSLSSDTSCWMVLATIFVFSISPTVGRLLYFVCSIDLTNARMPSEYILGSCGGPPWTIFKARNWRLLASKGGCKAHISKRRAPSDHTSVLKE